MKKSKGLLVACLFTFAGFTSEAQWNSGSAGAAPMTALNSGDIAALADVKTVNIVYDYTDLGVGAFRKEEDYIKKHCEDLEKKETGTCDKFKTGWVDARTRRYEPKFEEMFKKIGMKEINMDGNNNSKTSDYTLVVHTVFIELGTNAGIYKKPAYIDLECTFKDKQGKDLCVFYLKNAVGADVMGVDFAVEARVVESYAKAAKMLVLGIKKERKKAGK